MSTSTEVVTSVGNSWIICRSKSYAGRIYYFNTLTGEAAWNLSEPEIEKAKKRTSILESQTGFQIDNCPEPMDSPQDQSIQIASHSIIKNKPSQNVVPSKVYNKQIINNQFPKSPYPFTGQYPSISALNPIQLNIPVTPTFNPSMWNVSPHPIFVTSNAINQHPVMNNTFNNYDYVPVMNTSVPLSNRFQNLGISHMKTTLQKKSQINPGNEFRGKKNNYRNRFNNPGNKMDLRLLLSFKKRKPNIGNCELNEMEDFQQKHFDAKAGGNIQSTDRNAFHLIPGDDDDDDDIWLEESQRIQSSKYSLDISPLKKLLQVENNFEVWYIVFDSNVLLNNVNFLKMLLLSDKQCRLMVPQIVMDKIQLATNSRLRTQAHRAAYFISQQVDANVAVIDKGNEEENDDRNDIVNCCSKLTDQGYQVVLLTDDLELHNLEDTTRFLVFTVREIKKILSKSVSHGPINNSLEDLTLSQNRSIMITIPNEVNQINYNHVEQNKQRSTGIYSAESQTKANSIPKDGASEHIVVADFVETNKIHKTTDDVGIQANSTDLDIVHESNEIGTSFSNMNEKTKEAPLNCKSSDAINLTLNNIGPKKIKWHKRRAKFCLSQIVSHSEINETKQTNDSNISKERQQFKCKKVAGDTSNASNESLHPYNYEDSGETGSFVQRKCSRKLNTIGTTTSELSNNCSNLEMNYVENSGSVPDKSNYSKQKCFTKKSDNEDKNVMFEVTSSAMEDCLKRKCDEWLSRFVQIIEEATTQVLQQDPPFILDTMPPPWTIYEATECIKRKFPNDNDIVDAANKLLNVLFELGGLRGKIKIDVSPNKYMEMYSYGVYLIDALQSTDALLNNIEDLQVAAESLSKLLSDIQDSHLYSQDSFTDVSFDNVGNITEEQISNEKEIARTVNPDNVESATHSESKKVQLKNKSPTKKPRCETIISSPGSYNLRSHRKKLLQQKEEFSEKVTFIRNIDLESSFFTSLRLKKKIDTNKDIGVDVNNSVNDDTNIENREEFEVGNIENSCENVDKTCESVNIIEPEKNNISNEPKVIRNFTRCIEFENKLKNKLRDQNSIYDSWTFKNERHQNQMDCEENEQMDYALMESQYYYDDYGYEIFDPEEMTEVNLLDRGIEIEENVNSGVEKTDISFKIIIEKVEHNIREAFSSVHRFCEKCYTTISSDGSNFDKKEIQHAAEETHLYLNNLCDALNSILTRETSDSIYQLRQLLKIQELQEIIVENEDLEGYRNFIAKCLEQGNILKESVQLVIDASRE